MHVYAASGRHRKALHLRYRVQDDRGRTSERLLVYRKTKLLKTFSRPLRTTDDAVAYWVSFRFALAWRLPLLRPRDRRRGQPQPARLRGDPHSVEDPGRGGRPRPSSRVYGWPKTNGVPLTLSARRIAVRSVPPVKPVVT